MTLLRTFARGAALLLCAAAAPTARAEYLFSEFITPSFFGEPNTEASEWDVFYAPDFAPNYPDMFAPFGTKTTASAAGFSPPFDGAWDPLDPVAYWNTSNPTITQNGTSLASIIGPGITGNIYTPDATMAFRVDDATSYALGPVVFQFQTDGTAVNWSTLRLVYNTGAGNVSVAPAQLLREYHVSGSGFGGLLTRAAAQWDLTGLGVTSYRIEWVDEDSSLSFQRAFLDTAASSYGNVTVVPRAGQFIGGSGASWATAANWAGGQLPDANANAQFISGTGVTLDVSRPVGEVTFATAGNFTLSANAGATLTVNTGFTALTAQTVTVAAPILHGGYNVVDVAAGATLRFTGAHSGAFGLEKRGEGTLELAADNTFAGGISLDGGTLSITSTNHFSGTTVIADGRLELHQDVFATSGALGNAADPVILGLDDDIFETTDDDPRIILVGQRTFARPVSVSDSTAPKTLGVRDTGASGAVFSGNIQMDPAVTELRLAPEGAGDTLRFAGNFSGGSANLTVVRATGAGTVEFSGGNKTYAGSTVVESGTLLIATGAGYTGGGAFSVGAGGHLRVNGTLGAGGTLSMAGRLSGTGNISRSVSVLTGGSVSPGASVGALNVAGNVSFAAGSKYVWNLQDALLAPGTGWDVLAATGNLTLAGVIGQPVTLELATLDALGLPGLAAGFDPTADYTWVIAQAFAFSDPSGTGYFQINADDFENPYTGQFSIELLPGGQSLALHYAGAAIPEPAHAALAAGILLFSLILKQRRLRSP